MSSLLFHYHYFSIAEPEFGYGETTQQGNQEVCSYFIMLSEVFAFFVLRMIKSKLLLHGNNKLMLK